MSYRDDHDAALARVDALEAELARWHADGDVGEDEARAELARLEAEIKKLRKERDALHPNPRDPRRTLVLLMIAAGVTAAAALIYAPTSRRPAPRATPIARHTEVAVPSVARAAERPSHLMACVGKLDAVIVAEDSIGSDCMREIELQVDDRSLGDGVHAVLREWLLAEQAIADGGSSVPRDQLAREIHAVVRPEFIR